jgi:hypothetical protein
MDEKSQRDRNLSK